MASSLNQLIRFINNELRNYPWVKTSKLQQIFERHFGKQPSLRTIEKDMTAMQDPLGLDAPIEYDNKNKAYCYTDRNFTIEHIALASEEINALKFYGYALQLYSSCGVFQDYTNAIGNNPNPISVNRFS